MFLLWLSISFWLSICCGRRWRGQGLDGINQPTGGAAGARGRRRGRGDPHRVHGHRGQAPGARPSPPPLGAMSSPSTSPRPRIRSWCSAILDGGPSVPPLVNEPPGKWRCPPHPPPSLSLHNSRAAVAPPPQKNPSTPSQEVGPTHNGLSGSKPNIGEVKPPPLPPIN